MILFACTLTVPWRSHSWHWGQSCGKGLKGLHSGGWSPQENHFARPHTTGKTILQATFSGHVPGSMLYPKRSQGFVQWTKHIFSNVLLRPGQISSLCPIPLHECWRRHSRWSALLWSSSQSPASPPLTPASFPSAFVQQQTFNKVQTVQLNGRSFFNC